MSQPLAEPTAEELADPWKALLHPNDQQRFKEAILKVLVGPNNFHIEVRAKLRHDEYRWYSCRCASELGVNHQLRVAGTLMDVQERHILEDLSNQNTERLNLIISGVNGGQYDCPDLSESYIHLSPQLYNILGYDYDEVNMSLEWCFANIHPDDLPHVQQDIEEAVEHNRSLDTIFRFNYANREYRHFRSVASPTLNAAGEGRHRLTGMMLDVEQEQQLQAKLDATNERLQLVTNGAHGGVYDWPDTSKSYIQLYDNLCDLLGYGVYEVKHHMDWFWDKVYNDDAPLLRNAFNESFRTGVELDVHYRIRFKHLGYRQVRSVGSVTLDPTGGDKHRLTGMLLDVDEKYRAQLRLAAANEQLNQFSYLVAHDLGASLRHILGYASVLIEDYGTIFDETALSYIARIVSSGMNATRIIEDLHEYARTGTSQLKEQNVDLSILVEQVRNTLSVSGAANHVSWNIGKLPTILADEAQMRMLVQNLLANAIKFTRGRPNSGLISITSKDLDAAEVSITIKDNGAGFKPEFNAKIFGAFARAHTNDEFEGTGIGLANVAQIVARHGGRITAQGEVGVGATFTIVLPRIASKWSSGLDAAALVGRSVLLVE